MPEPIVLHQTDNVAILTAKALLFYGAAFYVLPQYFRTKRWLPLIGQLGLLLLASYTIEWGIHRLLLSQMISIPGGMDILLYLLFLFAAFAYRLSYDQ